MIIVPSVMIPQATPWRVNSESRLDVTNGKEDCAVIIMDSEEFLFNDDET